MIQQKEGERYRFEFKTLFVLPHPTQVLVVVKSERTLASGGISAKYTAATLSVRTMVIVRRFLMG